MKFYLYIFKGTSNDVVYSFHGQTAEQLRRKLQWLQSHGKLSSKGWMSAPYTIQYGDYE